MKRGTGGYLYRLKKQHYAGAAIMLMLYVCVSVCSSFNEKDKGYTAPGYNDFAGNEACVSCHKDICQSQVLTAHYHTSSPATITSIKGSFAGGQNTFTYNAFMQAEMDTANGVAYQTALINGVAYQTQSFDITVGSGRKGQTYLYWNNNNLYQLPVSYFTPMNTWCNSPGYPAGFIKFNRNINARCLDVTARMRKL